VQWKIIGYQHLRVDVIQIQIQRYFLIHIPDSKCFVQISNKGKLILRLYDCHGINSESGKYLQKIE
jgi:hypothetical protein